MYYLLQVESTVNLRMGYFNHPQFTIKSLTICYYLKISEEVQEAGIILIS
jgi:hypothetical protein